MSQSFNYSGANRHCLVFWRRIAAGRQQGRQAQEFCVAVNTVGRVSPLKNNGFSTPLKEMKKAACLLN